jgi:hypothetical protein
VMAANCLHIAVETGVGIRATRLGESPIG